MGPATFIAAVGDAAGRSFNRSITVVVHEPLKAATLGSTDAVDIMVCYRREPCVTPEIVVSGGIPPYTLTLTTSLPLGLQFSAGVFFGQTTGTHTGQNVPVTIVVTDAQGFNLTVSTSLEIRDLPPAVSSSTSVLVAVGATVGVVVTLLIGGMILLWRRRKARQQSKSSHELSALHRTVRGKFYYEVEGKDGPHDDDQADAWEDERLLRE